MLDNPILIPSLIIFVAFFVRALTGFGAGLISIPLLALFFDLKFVVPMEKIFEVSLSFLLIRKVWHAIDFKQITPVMFGYVIGIALGVHLLATSANDTLKFVLAAIVIIFSVYMARTARHPLQLVISTRWGFFIGLIGGFFGGLYGMGGPIIVLYFAHQVKSKEKLRATLIGLFFVSSFIAVCLYAYNGLFTKEMLQISLKLMPAFLLGTFLGYWAHFRVSEPFFRMLIAIILLISGILLLRS